MRVSRRVEAVRRFAQTLLIYLFIYLFILKHLRTSPAFRYLINELGGAMSPQRSGTQLLSVAFSMFR